MEFTQENLKYLILVALEDHGYYDALWGREGGKDAREQKGYYEGYAQALLDIYEVEDFYKSEEAVAAYEKGQDNYYNQDDDDTEDE